MTRPPYSLDATMKLPPHTPPAGDPPEVESDALIPEGPRRTLVYGLGYVLFALGMVGLALPVMPTAPFLVGAAACWARTSPGVYRWLLSHRLLGPPVREWRAHRSLTLRTKLAFIALVSVSTGGSIFFFAREGWPYVAALSLWLLLVILTLRLPTRPIRPSEVPS
ncbi:MAG: DUF454 domain-containing protein [Myxococcales bacterium]|nr:DUF454 domain-containing protein [Myxococcales bacterium]